MKILIVNAGSSSIKFQLLHMPSETLECMGLVERIGFEDAVLNYKTQAHKIKKNFPIFNHREGLVKVVEFLLDHEVGVIKNKKDIDVVVHRVVHGGSSFTETMQIDAEVKKEIENYSSLAPLHNPHNLEGINVAEDIFPQAAQIAVFDTAFHRTIPAYAGRYAIPESVFEKDGIQVYGFHGISHKYVAAKAAKHLNKENSAIVTIHLGNGCSMTAVKNGKSVDHSMGFSPSNGLIMGTRSGDIDHGVVFHMVTQLGYDVEEVQNILLKQSGMLGLTGDQDLRDVERRAMEGDRDCILALEMSAYRIKKYIGAYAAAMNGLDAIVFTAGIGENSDIIRKLVCTDMAYFGIHLDTSLNEGKISGVTPIQSSSSKVEILVIPTNEELEMAQEAYDLLV